MQIASSNITLVSQRQAVQRYTKREDLKVWVGERRPDFEGRTSGAFGAQRHRDRVQFSEAAAAAPSVEALVEEEQATRKENLRTQLLVRLVEKLTGKKLRLFDPRSLHADNEAVQKRLQDLEKLRSRGPQRAGFGVEYDAYESYYEAETTAFAAQGIVSTKDGQEIAIEVNLLLSRQYQEEQSVHLRAGDARFKDPLVINLSHDAVKLTETTFAFDVDADGQQDQIAFVQPGSGFLALDKNADGTINDGSELFGALSGDGFGDLTVYDTDGNLWIDEQDSVFEQLHIWTKDSSGSDQLAGLRDTGVGAIYLGHVATTFDLKDTTNNLQGRIRETGLYLQEDGNAGTIQKIDLTV